MEGQPLVILPESLISDIPAAFRQQPALDQSSNNFYYLLGSLRTREGWRQLTLTTDGLNITGMFTFRGQDNTFNLITASTAHVYKSAAPAYGSLTDITGGTLLTMADNAATVIAPLLDLVKTGFIATNNKDLPYMWKLGDATRTILSAAPISRSVCVSMVGISNSRVVFGNLVGFPSRVRWSALSDPTTYPATAIADLLATPDSIVTVRAFTRNAFAIYKDNSQWIGVAREGSDAQAFRFELIDRQPGPIGPNAVYDGPHNTHVYMGNDGNIYQFDGSSSRILSRTSDIISVLFDSTKTENNTILYDTKRNVVDAWIWPALDTGVGNLISISSGCSGLGAGAAITFRAITSSSSDTSALPAGTVLDDLLVGAILVKPDSVTVTGPPGWVKDIEAKPLSGSNRKVSYWHKVATASEPGSYTFVNAIEVAIARYDNNATTGSIFDVGASGSFISTATIHPPQVTTSQSKEMYICWITTTGSGVYAWNSPMVSRVTFSGDNVADTLEENAGLTVERTLTLTNGPTSGTILIATYKSKLVSDPACIGLITIFINPGVFGLVNFGNLNFGLIHSFHTGQIYQQTVLPKRMRALQTLRDVTARNRIAGLDASICVDDAGFDSFVGSITGQIAVTLPVLPGAEYEVDAIELFYDTHSSNESVSISILAGKNVTSLVETVISTSGLGGTDRKIARGINVRGRVVRINISAGFMSAFKVKRMEVTAWVRPLQTD